MAGNSLYGNFCCGYPLNITGYPHFLFLISVLKS